MKSFRTISAVVAALLVIVSSTTFEVGMHVCMGEVKSLAVFSKAAACEKERELPPCHRHATAPCCEDETLVRSGEQFNIWLDRLDFSVPAAVVSDHPFVLIAEIFPASHKSRTHFANYDPPLRSCDLTVAHRVLLI